MHRTSTGLKRLGIAVIAAATIGAGVPALVSGAAQAAGGPTSQLDITPASQTGTAGSCLAYTVTATDNNNGKPSDTPTVTVTLTQSSASTGTIGFCDPNSNKAPGAPGNPVQSPKTGNGTTAATTSQNFTTTRSPNGTVSATFGVYSSNVSTVNVRAQLTSNASVASNTATATYTAASPSPSPPASPPASPPVRGPLTLVVNTPLIPAGSTATLTGTGSANQQYELRCYTRPSTTYFTARSGAFDATASPVTFTLALGRNTRCFLQYLNNQASQTGSVVINVSTVLSLSTVRTAVRTYIFQGRNLPRVAGQLITLYRVDSAGNEIRTSNLVTDDSGIYRVTRKFTGTGTFRFKVRTSQTLNNAAGVSNTISVRVY